VETLDTIVELKRMHSQGHILLPVDWGKSAVGESGTVHCRGKGIRLSRALVHKSVFRKVV